MLRSIFFRRMLALLLLALLLWTLLTALIYNVVLRSILTDIKVGELEPKALSIARLVSRNYFQNDPYLNELIRSSMDLFDAWIFVVDGLSGDFRNTALPDAFRPAEPDIRQHIVGHMDQILSGTAASVSFTGQLKTDRAEEILFVGVPVTLELSRQKTVVGAVFFVQPLNELKAGLNSMSIALLLAALFVFLLMVIPVYWATARLIQPLRQTRNVAMALADGQFSLRADTRQKGEIGELAMTMNHLAETLSKTIWDLELERNRLKQIIDGMSDGLIAVDRSGQITQINQTAFLLLGLQPPASNKALPGASSISPPLAQAFRLAIDQAKPSAFLLDASGKKIRTQVTPLQDDQGQLAGAVSLLHDSTQAIHLEQTRRDYVANISHELRSPLTALRALVEPLNDGMVTSQADQQRYFTILLREIIRLSRLIDDMLELSRLQAEPVAASPQAFDLAGLLADLALRYQPQLVEKQLSLLIDEQASQAPQALADPDRIEQVLVILLDNAIKFTPAGGRIDLSVDWNEQVLRVNVRDTGIGIAPEDLPAVFDRFYKADKAHNESGTGLGLAIARELLAKMGQHIQVASQLGQGSIFTFTLDRVFDNQAPDKRPG